MNEQQARFERAIALFDAANAEDPNRDEGQPKELLYARRMTLTELTADAPRARASQAEPPAVALMN